MSDNSTPGRARWHAVCEDCDYEKRWGGEVIARDHAAIHERFHGHSVEVRDLFETDHRLPDELRDGFS